MADDLETQAFESKQDFYDWMLKNHTKPGLWLRFYKKDSGVRTITFAESTEVAICFGWIDSLMHKYDEQSYVLKYTPRRKGSNWSDRNIALAKEMIKAGRMQPTGFEQIERAKASGRWHD